MSTFFSSWSCFLPSCLCSSAAYSGAMLNAAAMMVVMSWCFIWFVSDLDVLRRFGRSETFLLLEIFRFEVAVAMEHPV